jgi:S-adenosylmethionine decarboxylase
MVTPSPGAHNPIIQGQDNGSCPFEGPEKLLEIWFERRTPHSSSGLRTVHRLVWEEMLSIVKCKVLSVINGREMDAYLLRFVSFLISGPLGRVI